MDPNDTQGLTLHRTGSSTVPSIARALVIVVAAVLAVGLGQAPRAGAHDDATTAHLWLGHIKPMKDPGTINSSTNPVDWTKLKGVPASIADGTDDGVEVAGPGLKKAFGVFFVDVTNAQRRVKTSCPAGQGIRAIDQQGAAACTKGPRGLSKTIADTGPMCNLSCTVGTLVLSPGTWQLSAKLEVYQSDFSEDSLVFDCYLAAGGESAQGGSLLHDSWGTVTFRLQLIATLSDDVNATLNCGDGDIGEARGLHLSIMAIRVSL